MRPVLKRRPSAAMVVALAALVLAASGSAVAASRLLTGDKLIRPNSLSGNRLRNHTISGLQLNLGKLGQVPNARRADRAFVAGSSENAVNAQDALRATTAQNAASLGGQPASAYLTSSSRLGTAGIVKVSGAHTGNTVTLFSAGPFTVTLTCTKTGSTTSLSVSASSSEAGSVLGGSLAPTAGSSVDVGPDVAATTGFGERSGLVALEAPSGNQAILSADDGVNSLGADCWANWAGIR